MARGRDRRLYRTTGATCALCGRHAGNAEDVPVYRYRLQRTAYGGGRRRSLSLGTLGLCDPCLYRAAEPVRDYSRRLPGYHRHPRLDGSGDEWHAHAGYLPMHRHDRLGADEGGEPESVLLVRSRPEA
jgi:hypothetical protein